MNILIILNFNIDQKLKSLYKILGIHNLNLKYHNSKEGIQALKDKADQLSMENLQLKYHINNLQKANDKLNLDADRKSDEIVKLQDQIASNRDEYNKIGIIFFFIFP